MKKLSDIINALPPEQREKIAAERDHFLHEHSSLRRMRKAMDISQTEVAKRIGTTPENVRQTEIRNDIMLSTLKRYINAIGGELKISVNLPGLGEVVMAPPPETRQ